MKREIHQFCLFVSFRVPVVNIRIRFFSSDPQDINAINSKLGHFGSTVPFRQFSYAVNLRLKLGRFDQHSGEHLTAEESPTEYLQVSVKKKYTRTYLSAYTCSWSSLRMLIFSIGPNKMYACCFFLTFWRNKVWYFLGAKFQKQSFSSKRSQGKRSTYSFRFFLYRFFFYKFVEKLHR